MKKVCSIMGLILAFSGALFLLENNYIFSRNPVIIIIQLFSAGLMIWARITFGLRSFHATANTTKGKLVTIGPYRWLRHPIYASIIYFFGAGIISYPFLEPIGAFILITVGLFIRILLEEKYLLKAYKDYPLYSKCTPRIIPFIF